MLATHYSGKAQPVTAKKQHGQVQSLLAPLDGMSLEARGSEGDQGTAIVLKNFTVENDRIQVRAGHVKKATINTAAVTVTSLSNANPAVCTVASVDISKFANGQTVTITGAIGALAPANGPHVISNVGSPANTFTLTGVDTSAGSAPQTTGIVAYAPPIVPPTTPIWCLIPYYGPSQSIAAASNHTLWNGLNGTLIKAGFTSDDWHWTSYSNLGDKEYAVMVNGADGVWSWDGGSTADGAPVTVTKITGTGPAGTETQISCVTTGFSNGQRVIVAGADVAHAAANGPQILKNVGSPAGTMTLAGCNTLSAGVDQTTGAMSVKTAGSVVKETITIDPNDTFISPNSFHIVMAHQNRLFFADQSNLAVYYLPLLQKSGLISYVPLNNVFKRGGYIKAMYTWTIEGGTNMNDQLVIFSSNGECAIYGGVDPDTDFQLSGVFRFHAPMSKHAVANYGGELYVFVPAGLMPMSTLMKAENEHLGQAEQKLVTTFLTDAIGYRTSPGWQAFINPSTGRLFCNIPQGSPNKYRQLVRHMPREVWTEFGELPARCWGWADPFVYFGDDNGNIYEMHPAHQTDNGKPIRVDVLFAWSRFKTAMRKKFHGVQAYIITDGDPRPVVDVKVDFDYNPGVNIPDTSGVLSGSLWNAAKWNVALWAPGKLARIIWNGVASSGTYGAVRVTADVNNCYFALTGVDVLFETGKFGP